jgi:hypothetical protein
MEGFGGHEPFRRAFGGRPPIGGQFGDYAYTLLHIVTHKIKKRFKLLMCLFDVSV